MTRRMEVATFPACVCHKRLILLSLLESGSHVFAEGWEGSVA